MKTKQSVVFTLLLCAALFIGGCCEGSQSSEQRVYAEGDIVILILENKRGQITKKHGSHYHVRLTTGDEVRRKGFELRPITTKANERKWSGQ